MLQKRAILTVVLVLVAALGTITILVHSAAANNVNVVRQFTFHNDTGPQNGLWLNLAGGPSGDFFNPTNSTPNWTCVENGPTGQWDCSGTPIAQNAYLTLAFSYKCHEPPTIDSWGWGARGGSPNSATPTVVDTNPNCAVQGTPIPASVGGIVALPDVASSPQARAGDQNNSGNNGWGWFFVAAGAGIVTLAAGYGALLVRARRAS